MTVYGIGADVYAPSLTKKTQIQESIQSVTHSPYETFAPQISDSRQFVSSYVGPTYVIDSTGTYLSKKSDATTSNTPTQTSSIDLPTSLSSTQDAEGDSSQENWTLIAVVGGVAILGAAWMMKGITRPKVRRK